MVHNKKYLPIIPKDKTFKAERENRLFAFVGEKNEVTELPYEEDSPPSAIFPR
ncbi:hypothetical protein [Flavitalea sp.]|nr:hypothetical protein [Flavitalea sp.]